jgi:hypothetical protein
MRAGGGKRHHEWLSGDKGKIPAVHQKKLAEAVFPAIVCNMACRPDDFNH